MMCVCVGPVGHISGLRHARASHLITLEHFQEAPRHIGVHDVALFGATECLLLGTHGFSADEAIRWTRKLRLR